MKNLFKMTLVTAFAIVAFQACKTEGDSPVKPDVNSVKVVKPTTENRKEIIKNYAKMVYQNYKDSYDAAVKMQGVINAFVEKPTLENMQKAKRAWLDAREPYGESEVFRGSNGPIDSESNEPWALNNEGQINAWPLNEAYIDYVKTYTDYTGKDGIYSQSIIGSDKPITKELLAGMNEAGDGSDEAAVSTGWHAIEFLLWGQDDQRPAPFTNKEDLSKNTTSGWRPVEDYTTKKGAERRKTYLKVVTQLLVDDLKELVDTWAEGGTYYKVFMALPEKEALKNIISGPQLLAMAELSNERMLVPAYGTGGFEECGQEDEHSCFSDNTHRDVYLNAKGIVNVLKGQYGSIKGTSFIDLVKAKDAKQGMKLEAKTNEMWTAIKAIDARAKTGIPFDQMILEEGKGNVGVVIKAADLLEELGNVIKESAGKLGITTPTRESYEPSDVDR